MLPEKGEYEPLLGYITLEECGAAVDVIGRRWIPAKYRDAKFCETDCAVVLRIGR